MRDKAFCFDQEQTGRNGMFKPALGGLFGCREVIIDAAREDGEPIKTNNCERAHCANSPRSAG